MLVITSAGLVVWQHGGLQGMTADRLSLRLFKNDITPTKSTLTGDFDEADFAGYQSRVLDFPGWVFVQNENGDALAIRPDVVWAQEDDLPSSYVYGYYVVRETDQRLMWAEKRGGGPVYMNEAGKTFVLRPRLLARNIPAP